MVHAIKWAIDSLKPILAELSLRTAEFLFTRIAFGAEKMMGMLIEF
jgi:hypothetical protein